MLLAVWMFSAAVPSAVLPLSSPEATPWVRDLLPGQPERFVVAREKGRELKVEVSAEVGRVRVQLLDPKGHLRLSWSVAPEGSRSAEFLTEERGPWTLVLGSQAVASCSVKLLEDRKAVPRDSLVWRAAQEGDTLVRALESGDQENAKALLVTTLEAYKTAYVDAPSEEAPRLEDLASRLDEVRSAEGKVVGERLLGSALEALARAGESETLDAARVTSALSDARYDRGDWEGSEELERQALAVRRHLLPEGDPAIARSLFGIAAPLFQQGRFADAWALEEEAHRILPDRQADPELYSDLLNLRGELQRAQGFHDAAEETFRQAMVGLSASTKEDADLLASLWNNLAGVFRDQARYDDARECIRKAVQIWAESGTENADRVETGLLNQAELLRFQGRVGDSVELYDEALAKARRSLEAGDPRLAVFLSQRAVAAAALGDPASAEGYYREALDVLKASVGLDHLQTAQTRYDRAQVLLTLGRFAEAQAEFRATLAVRLRFLGETHPEVAVARAGLARSLVVDGAGHLEEALGLLDDALDSLSHASAFPEARADAFAAKAEVLDAEGRRGDATLALSSALSIVEGLRPTGGGGDRTRAQFLARYHHWFDSMIDWQVSLGRIDLAFECVERFRARVLLDHLATAGVDLLTGVPDEKRRALQARESSTLAALQELQAQLQEARFRTDLPQADHERIEERLSAQLDRAARDLQEAQHDIQRASPLWAGHVTAGGGILDLAGAERRVGAIPTLVYHIGDSQSQVFLIRGKGKPALVESLLMDPQAAQDLGVQPGNLTSASLREIMSGEAGLEESSSLFVRGLKKVAAADGKGRRPLQRTLNGLWRVLVPRHFWRELQRSKEALIVPDAALNRLPFEALVVAEANEPRSPRYWLDEGPAVRYAPSLSVLSSIEGRARDTGPLSGRVVVIADPETGTGHASGGLELPSLPGARREAAAIQETFRGLRPVVVLEGKAATESELRHALDGGASYVHLATHGLVDERTDETLASVVLSPPEAGSPSHLDDGRLQLFEIYDLKLSLEVAVLSTCDSQVGRGVDGEGVFALSRGFLAAGARRVVASLWSVEDTSTAELMRHLYNRISKAEKRRHSVDYVGALRDAKRALRSDTRWAEPFFWAPFVLSGLP